MKCEKIEITTPFINLDSLLKFAGMVQTGGMAKEMIQKGQVYLNGETCLMRHKKIVAGDVITVGDSQLEVAARVG